MGTLKRTPEFWGVVANVGSDRPLRTNARVIILFSFGIRAYDNAVVHGLNKSGRIITKYMLFKRLKNFRPGWIPEGLRQVIDGTWTFATKEEAQKRADQLTDLFQDVRYCLPDGTINKDGISANESRKRRAAQGSVPPTEDSW